VIVEGRQLLRRSHGGFDGLGDLEKEALMQRVNNERWKQDGQSDLPQAPLQPSPVSTGASSCAHATAKPRLVCDLIWTEHHFLFRSANIWKSSRQ
jgi:hypothetical protein